MTSDASAGDSGTGDAGTGNADDSGSSDEELDRELGYVRDQIHELIELRDRQPLGPEERERYDALTRREKALIASRRRRRRSDTET
jgi:hypothetical protein